jgi:hypothetical protein
MITPTPRRRIATATRDQVIDIDARIALLELKIAELESIVKTDATEQPRRGRPPKE